MTQNNLNIPPPYAQKQNDDQERADFLIFTAIQTLQEALKKPAYSRIKYINLAIKLLTTQDE